MEHAFQTDRKLKDGTETDGNGRKMVERNQGWEA